MSKTISVCNQKGGVGKTTTTINLGAALAQEGIPILLIDLDPQANATGGLGVEKRGLSKSIYQVLFDGIPIQEVIVNTKVTNLSLIPSQTALSGAEVELLGMERREHRLKEVIAQAKEKHPFILIDCPPSLGLLTVNALTASDAVLIPLQCEYYALEGLSQLLETVRLVQQGLNPGLALEGILLTMADFRTKLTGDVIEETRRYFGEKVFETVIPRSIRMSEAPSHGLPITVYDPTSVGAIAYKSLAKKIKERFNARDTRFRQGDPSPHSGGELGTEAGTGGTDSHQVDPAREISAKAEP